jgi:hypothetical protein
MKAQIILIILIVLYNISFAQDITFVPKHTSISDTMGKEIVFEIDITNVSTIPQTVFLVRSQSNIPQGWSSSLCLDFCFPPHIDSVATTPDFGSNPLQPGELREVSLHVYTSPSQPGQGTIQLKAGTFRNPNQTITVNFTASTFNPTSVDDNFTTKDFYLAQNYPNPFSAKGRSTSGGNSSTLISWRSPIGGWQTLKVYDILGNEIATLVDEYREAGKYSIEFKSSVGSIQLPSGIYFYQLRIGNYVETKKMILEQ